MKQTVTLEVMTGNDNVANQSSFKPSVCRSVWTLL